MQPSSSTRRAALVIALASALLVAYFTTGEAVHNPASRLATMDALVHDHTFAIDRSPFRYTIDKVFVAGHLYSSKPPMLSTAGAGVYWVVNRVAGLSFRDETRPSAVYAVTLVLMLGAHLLLLAYAYRLLSAWEPRGEVLLPAFAAVALGSLVLGYATSINNHTPAAALALASFTHAWEARRGSASPGRQLALAGALGALAVTMDLAAVFVSVAIGLYVLAHDPRRFLRAFLPAAAPVIALHFALTWAVAGSLLPIYLHKEAYLYPGSYWLEPIGMDLLDEPKGVYLVNMLVGHHGLFAMTPLLVLAAVAIGRSAWRRDEHWREAFVAGGSLAALVVFYAATTRNYGGDCVGFRWFLVVTPLVLVFVADWLRGTHGRAALVSFALFFAVGAAHAADALAGPWRTSMWQQVLARWGLG